MTFHLVPAPPVDRLHGHRLRQEIADRLGIERVQVQLVHVGEHLEIRVPDEHDEHDLIRLAVASHTGGLLPQEQQLADARVELSTILAQLQALPAQQNPILALTIRTLKALVTLETVQPVRPD